MIELTTIKGGGEKPVKVYLQRNPNGEVITFIGDADIDADGANGQNGAKPAYDKWDTGSEFLGNGGMKRTPDGDIWFSHDWGKDVAFVNNVGQPLVLPNGVIPSRTSYKLPDVDGPEAYIDSETIPYICLPPIIRMKADGTVLGCVGKITNLRNKMSTPVMVADFGPRNKIGEISIEAARRIGIRASPRTGGTDELIVAYEVQPGKQFTYNGFTYPLIPFRG